MYLENPEHIGWQNIVSADQKSALLKKWSALDATEKLGRSYVMLSNDGGKTWETPVAVPVATPHGPVLCNDGRTLLLIGVPRAATMAGFNNMDMQHLYVVKSIDFGKTWRLEATLDKPLPTDKPFTAFCEPYILQLRDGSFIASARGQTGGDNDLLRTYLAFSKDGKNWSDFEEVEGIIGAPAHLFETKAGVLIMAYSYRLSPTGSRAMISYDGGKTWSKPVLLVKGGYPMHLCRHSSGALIAVYGWRHEPFGQQAIISYDRGETWSEKILLRNDGPSGDLGYPCTAELPDGKLMTVYYQTIPHQDKNPCLQYTIWTLDEVK
jgi:hypothetical protein